MTNFDQSDVAAKSAFSRAKINPHEQICSNASAIFMQMPHIKIGWSYNVHYGHISIKLYGFPLAFPRGNSGQIFLILPTPHTKESLLFP